MWHAEADFTFPLLFQRHSDFIENNENCAAQSVSDLRELQAPLRTDM